MSDQIDIMSAIRQIAAERKIDPDEIIEAIKEAIKTGFRREYGVENLDLLTVDFEPEEGFIAVYINKKVVEKVENPQEEIALNEALEYDKKVKIGDELLIDITPEGDFGRIAAQTARQIILQHLREAEKTAAISEIKKKLGTIENVIVQRFTAQKELIGEINRARAVMPPHEQIPMEFYKIGSRIKVLLKSIETDERGEYVLISRSDPEFLRELFRIEVPEIDSKSVEIVNIAREAGSRAKVAVKSNAPGVDPIGACIGQKGARINSISNELKLGNFEEKIDIIEWSESVETFLSNSIRPADAIEVIIKDKDKREALIVVPDEHLSLAIGRDGQNVRLSSKLTGWNLDIVSESEYKNKKSSQKSSEEQSKSENLPSEELSNLELSSRILSTLAKNGINSIETLKQKIENGEKIPGIGDKSIEEIKKAIGL
jgi:N utilization substance protein A